MRATERAAFLREMEEAESERQQEERQTAELHAIATQILSFFGLEAYVARFIASSDGLAILANCCNAAAKWHNDDLYQYKPLLIDLATEYHPECWQDGGVVYIETSIGQVSFHALCDEDKGLPEAHGRVWSEIEYQFNAPLVAQAWVEGWRKERLHQRIAEKSLVLQQV